MQVVRRILGTGPLRWLRAGLVISPLLVLSIAWLRPGPARGLPLFARKNGIPCTTCHLAFPRLNSFGMAFRQNGYRMPGVKGENPWEAKEFPLAVVGNVGYDYTSTDAADSTGKRSRTAVSQFRQNTSEFHSAGTLAEKITFHFDNNFAGVNGPLNSGMAFVQFDDVAKDGKLNVKLGIYDAEIPYLSDSRRTTWSHYLSPVTLNGQGIEFNGTQSGWTYAAGINNSMRTHGKADDKTLNTFENPYVWLLRDFSGQMVCARVFLDQQDPRDTTKSSSQHVQAEFNAYLNHGRWVVIPGVTYEHFADADPTQRDKMITGLLEALYFLDKDSRWLATARFELRHMPKFDFQGSTAFAEEDDQQIVANLGWYANPNCKIALEWTHNADNIQGPKIDEVQAFVHLAY